MTTRSRTKKPTAPRARKYKTPEGDYLVITDVADEIRIAWFIAEWDDVGGCTGEHRLPSFEAPKSKDDWEVWQADRAVAPLTSGRDSTGFHFATQQQARLALKAANEALFSGNSPWPAWATQAKTAGWTPPKGWKP